MNQVVQRGDVFWANLDPTIGVEIKKVRPVVVVSNNVINQRSQLVIIVPLTTNVERLSPSHVLIPRGEGGLEQDSKACPATKGSVEGRLRSKSAQWINNA